MKIYALLVSHISLCCYARIIDFGDRPRNFSIELLHYTQAETNGHVVISPFGIWTLMSAIANGAAGDSYKQIVKAFRLPNNQNEFINGYTELSESVLKPEDGSGVSITSKNFVFVDNSFRIRSQFSQSVRNDFKATITALDFQDPEVAYAANNQIKRIAGNFKNVLYPQDFIDSRMILTNVISFKGLWSLPFNASETKEEEFYDENNKVAGKVNMMKQQAAFAFSNMWSLGAFALEMPYGTDRRYCMLYLLPHPRVKVADAYQKLSTVSFKDIFKRLEGDIEEYGEQDVDVKIPRFKISTNLAMNKPLNDMGVYDIFQPDLANLKRISDEEIYVSAIVHKANIEVTESGTVASAVTEAIFANRMSTPKFYANRPFIYFLMEKSTLTVLFSGIYSQPTVF